MDDQDVWTNKDVCKNKDRPHNSTRSKFTKRWLLAGCLCFALPSAAAILDNASKFVAFGDSWSSTEFYGQQFRWTNDLVWLEYLGHSLDTPIENYAYAGGYTADDGTMFSAFIQIARYGAADPNAVHFVFFTGGNDTRIGLTPEATKANLSLAITNLIDRGASKIVLINSYGDRAFTDAERQLYLPESVVVYDFTAFLNTIVPKYGIADWTTPCYSAPATCDTSLIWDGYGHPASGFHKSFATDLQNNLSEVPIPATTWVFGSAVFGLFGFTRRSDSA